MAVARTIDSIFFAHVCVRVLLLSTMKTFGFILGDEQCCRRTDRDKEAKLSALARLLELLESKKSQNSLGAPRNLSFPIPLASLSSFLAKLILVEAPTILTSS